MLHFQARDLLQVYRTKSGHESELPTVSTQLRNTNKCIVNAMSCLAVSLEALSANLSDALPSIPAMVEAAFDIPTPQQGSSGKDVVQLEDRADEEESDRGDEGQQQVG